MQDPDDGCQDLGRGDDSYLYNYEDFYGEYHGFDKQRYPERSYPEAAAYSHRGARCV